MDHERRGEGETEPYGEGMVSRQANHARKMVQKTPSSDLEIIDLTTRDYNIRMRMMDLIENMHKETVENITVQNSIFPKGTLRRILAVLGILGAGVAINGLTQMFQKWIPIFERPF